VDAVTDGLTALYNQRYIKQRLGEEVARATEIGHPLTLLFCDLDHFKGYNDRRGHTAGDRALRVVSGVLLRSVRKIDLAARHSGEEFTVILMDTTPDGALEVAERIRAGVAGLDLGGPDRELTVSVGIATSPDDAALWELVDKADWAMYLATRQGRDRVLPFGPGAHEQTSGARATKWTATHPSGRRIVLPCWLESPHSFPSPGQRKESA
jgi:diguanylate cyclase (GGDEF)-like protein